jgi:hypothetical protein
MAKPSRPQQGSPFDALIAARRQQQAGAQPDMEENRQTARQSDGLLADQSAGRPSARSDSRPAAQPDSRLAARPLAKRSDTDFVKFTTYVRRDTHRAVKVRLVQQGRELSDLVEQLLADWLAKHS